MKKLKILNTIALLIPIVLGILGFINPLYFTFALFSTILTGFIQVIIALYFAFYRPKNNYIKVYFLLLIGFFIGWLGLNFNDYIWSIPVILSIYLSILLYSSVSEETSFMKAEWNDLLFINYEINPEALKKYVPKGTEIDLWNGKCYISLIGFMFEDVKVLGMKIPYHINFEEVNLRFYVRRFENGIWKRGVVFVKEIVPKHAITFVANTLYNEQYQTLPMRHERKTDNEKLLFKYEWKKNNSWNSISVQTDNTLIAIEENSEAEFISEHYYGYSISPRKKTVEYEVKHPRWQQYQVTDYELDVDFKTTYGEEFSFLQTLKPASCFVAKGSKISIESKKVF